MSSASFPRPLIPWHQSLGRRPAAVSVHRCRPARPAPIHAAGPPPRPNGSRIRPAGRASACRAPGGGTGSGGCRALWADRGHRSRHMPKSLIGLMGDPRRRRDCRSLRPDPSSPPPPPGGDVPDAPMREGPTGRIGIVADQHEAPGAVGHIGPRQRRRHVVAVAGEPAGDRPVGVEGWRSQRESHRSVSLNVGRPAVWRALAGRPWPANRWPARRRPRATACGRLLEGSRKTAGLP